VNMCANMALVELTDEFHILMPLHVGE